MTSDDIDRIRELAWWLLPLARRTRQQLLSRALEQQLGPWGYLTLGAVLSAGTLAVTGGGLIAAGPAIVRALWQWLAADGTTWSLVGILAALVLVVQLLAVPFAVISAGLARRKRLIRAADGRRPDWSDEEQAARDTRRERLLADATSGPDGGPVPLPSLTADGRPLLGLVSRGDVSPRHIVAAGTEIDGFSITEDDIQRSVVIVGETGAGKTQTMLRLAAIGYAGFLSCACGPMGYRHGFHPFIIDPKNSAQTAERFFGLMVSVGISPDKVGLFPDRPYDIWRGEPAAVGERLVALVGVVDEGPASFYAKPLELLIHAACAIGASSPDGWEELLSRLHVDKLKTVAATLAERDAIERAAKAHLDDITMQVLNLKRLVGHLLRGGPDSWAIEDVDAAYVRLESTVQHRAGFKIAQAITADFPHAWAHRQTTPRRGLLYIDEYPQVVGEGSNVANLVETLRESGAAIAVGVQSYQGMGPTADRILGASGGMLILHRTKDPQPFLALMGSERRPEVTAKVVGEHGWGDEGSRRVVEHYRTGADPNRIRRYAAGRCTVYTGDTCAEIHVSIPCGD